MDRFTITNLFGKPCKRAESEDSVGARRMPWRRKPTKGAASRDSPGGGANVRRSRGARMGEPGGGHAPPPAPESIGCEEATRGTETSKYPEEEKSTEIALVAASERARCPNRRDRHSLEALARRCCGGRCRRAPDLRRGQKSGAQPNGLGRPAAQGESPVGEELRTACPPSRVGPATWNPGRIRGDHPPRLNTLLRPIANQYREGKVKSTPRGE